MRKAFFRMGFIAAIQRKIKGVKMKNINIIRLENCELPIPKKGTKHSACFDLSSNFDAAVSKGSRLVFSTGFKWEIPNGYCGIIKPRSGLAFKNGIDVLAGVIDSDYRGEIKVILINHGRECFIVKKGDRIAQMLIVKNDDFIISLYNEKLKTSLTSKPNELSETERGQNGFGSTGK